MAVDLSKFLGNIPSPVQRIREGALFGQQQADRRTELEAARLQREQQQQINAELAALAQKENKTPEDFINLMTRFPSISQQFQAPLDALNTQQRKTAISEATNVFAALSGGNSEAAIKLLEDKKTASENSGDEIGARRAEILIESIKLNPDAALTSAGLFLSQAVGGEKFASTFETLTGRAGEKAEAAIAKAAAETDKTIAETLKIKAETGEEEIPEFKNIVQNPDGSSIGTNTLTGKREIIPTNFEGAAPQTKAQFEAINKLVEVAKKDDRVKDFVQVSTKFDRIESALDTAAGDISLIFAFMKMLDPGSTVREGEFATAQNSGSVNENIWATYNKAITGERLVPSRRADFKAQSVAIFDKSKKTALKTIEPIMGQAKRFKLRPETIEEAIFGLPEEVQEESVEAVDTGRVNATGERLFQLSDGSFVARK
jgi:hypothetical protein